MPKKPINVVVKCRDCNTSEGCSKHRRFKCPRCSRVVEWQDGAADDAPDWCSDCWAATIDSEAVGYRLDKAGVARMSSVQKDGQDYVMVAQTRDGGPPFSDWWESVDDAVVLLASKYGKRERDRVLAIDLWDHVEAAQKLYDVGKKPATAAGFIVRMTRDAPPDKLGEVLDAAIKKHGRELRRGDGRGYPIGCTCGQGWPCPVLETELQARVYRLGHAEHSHLTRQVMALGDGCPACDATHDLANIEQRRYDIELVDELVDIELVDEPELDEAALLAALSRVINRHSLERPSNTAGFILADYLVACLEAFHAAALARQKWYGEG